MVELIVEHWHNPDGSDHFLWSVWRDGKREHKQRSPLPPLDLAQLGRPRGLVTESAGSHRAVDVGRPL